MNARDDRSAERDAQEVDDQRVIVPTRRMHNFGSGMQRNAAGLWYPHNAGLGMHGLTYSLGTDTVNDTNIAAGGAMSATDNYWMILPAALGKQSDVAWAAGGTAAAPVGMLDTGTVGNSDYYLYAIARTDIGVTDVICSLAAPTVGPLMPTNYTKFRVFGFFIRRAGTIVAFTTYETEGGGLKLLWSVPTLDINLANTLTTARRTDAMKVPLGFSVTAIILIEVFDAAIASIARVMCPNETDAAVDGTNSNVLGLTGASGVAELHILTSSTGLIASRANVATVDTFKGRTLGFSWPRRN